MFDRESAPQQPPRNAALLAAALQRPRSLVRERITRSAAVANALVPLPTEVIAAGDDAFPKHHHHGETRA